MAVKPNLLPYNIDLVDSLGVPSSFTSREVTGDDNGKVFVCSTTQVATVPTGLPVGFGCTFKGGVSFVGTATTTDERTAGVTYPWCALIQTGVDTYSAVGGKA